MSDELIKKLSEEIETCSWNDLEDHYQRGAILLIDTSLDLVEVGVAMAKDQADVIEKWLERDMIQKISSDQRDIWQKNPKEKISRFLIIQPYVLIQVLA